VSRRAWIALAAVVALVVAAQVAIPRIAEDRIADRLTAGGGSVDVSVSAFPAPRLLFGDGDTLRVRGTGLNLDLASQGSAGEPAGQGSTAFDRLDGFGQVNLVITRSTAGPIDIADFELSRDGPGPYHLVARASTTPRDLVAFSAARLPFLGGGLALLFGAGGALGSSADEHIPMRMDMELQSEGGRVVVVAGGGTVAGIPTGPLAELITSAIAIRL
jgi:hypothetical protein